jgi:hypothetical protein
MRSIAANSAGDTEDAAVEIDVPFIGPVMLLKTEIECRDKP